MTEQPDWIFYRDGKHGPEELMPRLVAEFPGFRPRWEKHLHYWNGEPAGAYNDIAEFARYVVKELYPAKETEEIHRAFDIMEEFLASGNQQVQELVAVGFLEDVRNIGSWEAFGSAAFIPFLGQKSREEWDELENVWAGKTSLMEVLEVEQKSRRKGGPE
jgi:hypothetical protein